MNQPLVVLNPESAVTERYSAAANSREEALCCPVVYDKQLLEVIPAEIIERDYGCGDPSAYVRSGDVVLDLGSGCGKLCYIASQVVGENGKVIGVDRNPEMLAVARKYSNEIAEKIGYSNVVFRCGRIQDLAVDIEQLGEQVDALKINGTERSLAVLDLMNAMRMQNPMIPDDSVDCVISNCVLNLINPQDRRQLFQEIFRVLRPGGRAAISDIVCDESVPVDLQNDPELWSGCISGAWREDRFVDEFVAAGFHGISIDKYQTNPWQVVEGIEFRSVTVLAYKGMSGPDLDCNQAVIYNGPFAAVQDEFEQFYERGRRTAVSNRTFERLQDEPYSDSFNFVHSYEEVLEADAPEFAPDCKGVRSPQETKAGLSVQSSPVSNNTTGDCCGNTGCCS